MKRIYLPLFGLLLTALTSTAVETVRIGIVLDGPWSRNVEMLSLIRQEIVDILEPEFETFFPEDQIVTCDWTSETIKWELERLLVDTEIDVVIGAGVIASQYLGTNGPYTKPVIAPFVIDPEIQGIPNINGRSGVTNLSYIVYPKIIERDLELFREIVKFDDLAVLHLGQFHELISSRLPRDSDAGYDITFIPVDFDIDIALEALPEETDAVLLMPLLQLSVEKHAQLIAEINERKLPTYSYLGEEEVEAGVLAGNRAEAFEVVTRRIALNLQRMLLGEDGGTLPARCTTSERLIINMQTAREIGVSPPWKVLTEATLINQARSRVAREWTLRSAMENALETNPELAARAEALLANRQNIGTARANLLPKITLDGSAVIIDDDRAEASLGSQAERTYSVGATLTQLLFSESAWANLSVQRHLHVSSESAYLQAELDIALDVATSYLELLQAKTLEQLRKDNLRVTRSNLELSELREAIGSANPNEIYRWEAELATDRAEVIEASAIRNIAEIQFNRMLARPSEETMEIANVNLANSELLIADGKLDPYIGDPWSFRTYREFMVEEALRSSPELLRLDAMITARRRALASANRSFFLPTISLQGQFSNRFQEDGAGSEASALPAGFAGAFPAADEKDWSVALVGSFPLFTGGAKRFSQLQARFELTDLEYQRENISNVIEQSVRSALHAAGASYAAIGLTEDAANAARQSLDAVTDAYASGVVNITELLDAQNISLAAEVRAANAIYSYLIDYMHVQRSAGKFDVYLTDAERADFYARVEDYFTSANSNR